MDSAMNVSPFLAEPPMNALRGKRLDFAFSERKNVPYRNYNRGWVGSHQPSSSERAFRRFAALGTVTAAILLVFTCATLIAKPLWSWKLGRRLASGKGLRDVQDGREDSLDICAPGETSNDQKSEPYPYTAMPPERAPKEVFLAKDIGKLAPRQAESAQLEMEPATDRSDARLRKQERSQNRTRGTHVSQEGEEKDNKGKEALHERQRGRTGRQLGSHAHRSSEEEQLEFWLSSTVGDSSPSKPSAKIQSTPPSAKVLYTPLSSSLSLSSVEVVESVGGLRRGPTPAVSVAPSPLDINLESLVDDEELILRSWFPEPPKDSRPASHFDSHFDTEATFSECEDLRCYREAGNGPTISSTDSGLRQSHPVGSSLAKVGSGTSDVTMQVIQAEPERSAEGESLAVVPALGTSNDISGHPFFRLPSVPPGLSARQFDVANIGVSGSIRSRPVFVLDSIRAIFLKPTLTKGDLDHLVSSVERLCTYALKYMDISLSGIYPCNYVNIVGTVFLVVDTLYCAIQLLGQSANGQEWWPQLIERIKTVASSFKRESPGHRMRSRDKKLVSALLTAIATYTRGARPSAETVVSLKRSLLCRPRRTKFQRATWDPWRRDDRMWRGARTR